MVQPYQHHRSIPAPGINCYSFALNPEDDQPSGSCNMSRIDLVQLQLALRWIFHKKNNKMVTLTAVRPPARFGAIKINRNYVTYFKEKSKLDEGWINGGFFVINKIEARE